MSLETILIAIGVALLVLIGVALLAWWLIGRRGRALASRIGALSMHQKAQLAGALYGDPRLPLPNRIALMALIVYVALPIDLIPDFIPLLGQIDDAVMLGLGAAIMMHSVPQAVFEEHLRRLEGETQRQAA